MDQIEDKVLQDRVILVTGAGQGIGRTAALTFAAAGATVILLGRSATKLEAVYDEIMAQGGPEPIFLNIDLAQMTQRSFEEFAHRVKLELGKIDGILHNAAAFYNLSPLHLQNIEQWEKLMRVNVIAPFALNQAFLPLLKNAPDAAVILTGETHGLEPNAFWGGFAVSNGALLTYLKIQAAEWEMYPNLRVNLLIPGAVQSPQRAKTHPGEVHENLPLPDALMDEYLYWMSAASRGRSGEIVMLNDPEELITES